MSKKALRNRKEFLRNSKYHVKAYKAKKTWLFAGLFALALGGAAVTAGDNTSVHADAANNANADNINNTNVRHEQTKSTLTSGANTNTANTNVQSKAADQNQPRTNVSNNASQNTSSNVTNNLLRGRHLLGSAPNNQQNGQQNTPNVPTSTSASVGVTGDQVYADLPITVRFGASGNGPKSNYDSTVYIKANDLINGASNHSNNGLNVGDTYYINLGSNNSFVKSYIANSDTDMQDYSLSSGTDFAIKFADDPNNSLALYGENLSISHPEMSEIATLSGIEDPINISSNGSNTTGYAFVTKSGSAGMSFESGNISGAKTSVGSSAIAGDSLMAVDYQVNSRNLHVLYVNQAGDMLNPTNGDVLQYGTNTGQVTSAEAGLNSGNPAYSSGAAVHYTSAIANHLAAASYSNDSFYQSANNKASGNSGSVSDNDLSSYDFANSDATFQDPNYNNYAPYSGTESDSGKYVTLFASQGPKSVSVSGYNGSAVYPGDKIIVVPTSAEIPKSSSANDIRYVVPNNSNPDNNLIPSDPNKTSEEGTVDANGNFVPENVPGNWSLASAQIDYHFYDNNPTDPDYQKYITKSGSAVKSSNDATVYSISGALTSDDRADKIFDIDNSSANADTSGFDLDNSDASNVDGIDQYVTMPGSGTSDEVIDVQENSSALNSGSVASIASNSSSTMTSANGYFDIQAQVTANNGGGAINTVNIPIKDITVSDNTSAMGSAIPLTDADIRNAIAAYNKSNYTDYYGIAGDLDGDSFKRKSGNNNTIYYKYVKSGKSDIAVLTNSSAGNSDINSNAGNYEFNPGRMYVDYVGTAVYRDANTAKPGDSAGTKNNSNAEPESTTITGIPVEAVIAEGYVDETVTPYMNRELNSAFDAQGWHIDEAGAATASATISGSADANYSNEASYSGKGLQIGYAVYDAQYVKSGTPSEMSYSDYSANPSAHASAAINANTVPELTSSTQKPVPRKWNGKTSSVSDYYNAVPQFTRTMLGASQSTSTGSNDSIARVNNLTARVNHALGAVEPVARTTHLLGDTPTNSHLIIPVSNGGQKVTDVINFEDVGQNDRIIDHGSLIGTNGTVIPLTNIHIPAGYHYVTKPGNAEFDAAHTYNIQIAKNAKGYAILVYYGPDGQVVGTHKESGTDGTEVPAGDYAKFAPKGYHTESNINMNLQYGDNNPSIRVNVIPNSPVTPPNHHNGGNNQPNRPNNPSQPVNPNDNNGNKTNPVTPNQPNNDSGDSRHPKSNGGNNTPNNPGQPVTPGSSSTPSNHGSSAAPSSSNPAPSNHSSSVPNSSSAPAPSNPGSSSTPSGSRSSSSVPSNGGSTTPSSNSGSSVTPSNGSSSAPASPSNHGSQIPVPGSSVTPSNHGSSVAPSSGSTIPSNNGSASAPSNHSSSADTSYVGSIVSSAVSSAYSKDRPAFGSLYTEVNSLQNTLNHTKSSTPSSASGDWTEVGSQAGSWRYLRLLDNGKNVDLHTTLNFGTKNDKDLGYFTPNQFLTFRILQTYHRTVNGQPQVRVLIQDFNHLDVYGYIDGSPSLVERAYYNDVEDTDNLKNKTVVVRGHYPGIEIHSTKDNWNRSNYRHYLKPGQKIQVLGLVPSGGGLYRFAVRYHGHTDYITANKNFVKVV